MGFFKNNKFDKSIFDKFTFSIKVLPPMVFENLNSLETLNIQNNKLSKLPEDIMEPLMDSLRVVDITGEFLRKVE